VADKKKLATLRCLLLQVVLAASIVVLPVFICGRYEAVTVHRASHGWSRTVARKFSIGREGFAFLRGGGLTF